MTNAFCMGSISMRIKKNVSKNKLFTPDYSVGLLSQVIESSSLNESGSLLSYDGVIIKP